MPEKTPRPRPLLNEPVSVDLVNTRWIEGGAHHDLLDSLDGLVQWFDESGLAPCFDAGAAALDHLLTTRDALARLVEDPRAPGATADLNAVLVHGRVRRYLDQGGPASTVEFETPSWGPAWIAAADFLDLRERSDRIRSCANPGCILYFFDTSKNGTRRWCSMSGCGNRAKAARHHARERAGRTA